MDPNSEVTITNAFYSFTIISLVTAFSIHNLAKCSKIFYDFLTKYPGVGTLKTVDKSVVVSTEIGDISLPLFKLNNLDIDIYFFEDEQVDDDLSFKDYVFDELFGDLKTFDLKRYGTHFIKNINKPSDFKGRSQISGYVRSFLEDKVLVFTIKDDKIIDYKKLIDKFIDYNYEEDEDEEDEDEDEDEDGFNKIKNSTEN